ncbi:dolichyl-P-Glc:Glc2Man9GlcNAc2-PP-dolichol alpha-1,2-glucosyltransferase [Ranunculus cassubicifolius]
MGRVVVALIASLWIIPISLFVNRIVPEPYMDEIFHIPQAQQYCKGNFKSWDPMITTPPGLYCLSLVHIASLFPGMSYAKSVTSFFELCSAAVLRSINGVLAVICSLFIYEILMQLKPALSKRKAVFQAVVLSLYPLHWFFTFLYYTDVASVTIVLAMYLACLRQHFQLSALLGALAILIRQTNVVWMVLVASTGILKCITPSNCKESAQSDDQDGSPSKYNALHEKESVPMGSNLRKRKSGTSLTAPGRYMSERIASPNSASGFFDEVQVILERLWLLKWEILVSFTPFLVVLLAFIAFVLWNGSIVLGAKEAHVVSRHFAQIMYFGLISSLAMAPLTFSFSQFSLLYRSLRMNKLSSFFQILSGLTVGFISVHFFSIEHPYLVADNRHYTFYIWRRVIKYNWFIKYLLIPLYVYSWLSIFNILGRVEKKIWTMIFFVACAATLIPAPLIEFRYYTIPFYFLILHSRIDDTKSWALMGLMYVAVNIFTMVMFLFYPFHWNHEPGVQRFIW